MDKDSFEGDKKAKITAIIMLYISTVPFIKALQPSSA